MKDDMPSWGAIIAMLLVDLVIYVLIGVLVAKAITDITNWEYLPTLILAFGIPFLFSYNHRAVTWKQ